jgi:hypothetical protein
MYATARAETRHRARPRRKGLGGMERRRRREESLRVHYEFDGSARFVGPRLERLLDARQTCRPQEHLPLGVQVGGGGGEGPAGSTTTGG